MIRINDPKIHHINARIKEICDAVDLDSTESKEKARHDLADLFSQRQRVWEAEGIADYNDYLQSEGWQRVRGAALRRAEYRCQVCNAFGWLDVHHRTYERVGREELGDLVVLCRKCHALFHNK